MKRTVFVQANDRQLFAARVAAYSHARFDSGRCDVRIIHINDFPILTRPDRSIVRGAKVVTWNPADLQSFTPLRFAPPSLMSFEGRALVTDPDCFALRKTDELLMCDMGRRAILAAWQPWHGETRPHWASSVMLLDCRKLQHWDLDAMLAGLFSHRFDYQAWNRLELEDQGSIGELDPMWNSFDQLTSSTNILHMTRRRTQPWKTGLPIDYTFYKRRPLLGWLRAPRYHRHPDRNQEALFYSLVAEMSDAGLVTRKELVREMEAKNLRPDSPRLIDLYRGWKPIWD